MPSPAWVSVAVLTVLAPAALPGQANQHRFPPDVIFHNGKIVTVNDRFDVVRAIAVRDGRIMAAGSDSDVRQLAGPNTRIVDLAGKTVLPGFYDNHNHNGPEDADPRVQDWRDINSRRALLQALRRRAGQIRSGAWIIGSLKNENMPQERLPNRWQIDSVVPNHPVFLRRGHISIANSAAIRLAGITRDSPQPPGGSIEKNDAGEPMGWFRESSGHRRIERVIPPPPPPDPEEARRSLQEQLQGLFAYGITSVNVPGVRPNDFRWFQDIYARSGVALPRATLQLRVRPGFDDYDDPQEGIAVAIREIESLSFHTGFGNDRLRIGAIKMSIDGGFSAAGFWTIPSYPNREGYHGVIRIPEEIFYPVAKRAHDLGWQLGVHAIGDGAIQMVVDALERILAENPRPDHRHYIHHFSVMPPRETFEKMARLGILVSSQPNFTYSLGPYNASPGLTPERLATNNPQRTVLQYGIPLSYGSDGMPTGPLVGIYAAVTRKGVDGKVYGPEERLRIQEAIRGYTLAPAYQTFDERNRGSLEVGKYADMIVLSEDILTLSPDRIMELKVEQTILGGEVVHTQMVSRAAR